MPHAQLRALRLHEVFSGWFSCFVMCEKSFPILRSVQSPTLSYNSFTLFFWKLSSNLPGTDFVYGVR